MNIIAIFVPAAVAVIGLVIYVLPRGSTERKEIGRQLMFCGFFFTVYLLAMKQIKL